jgi:hypothetical protein
MWSHLKVQIRHLCRDTEGNHEKPQPELLITQPGLEPGNSRKYVCRIIATITYFIDNFRAINIIKECDKIISVVITLQNLSRVCFYFTSWLHLYSK